MEGKKVLITGGGGFIGSHLANLLTSRGAQVFLLDIDGSNVNEIKNHDAELFIGDVSHKQTVDNMLEMFWPDEIVHLAGVSHTVASALGQVSALMPGMIGLATLQDAVRNQPMKKAPRISIASSSLTSGMFHANDTYRVPNDAHKISLRDCYHQYVDNKLGMEMLCFSNYARFMQEFTIFRFGTQYGPRMCRNVVTWYFIRNALLGRPMEIHGDGLQERQHFYVEDLVEGIFLILKYRGLTRNKTISLVPDYMTSVKDIARAVQHVIPKAVIKHVQRRTIDVRVKKIAPPKDLVDLGWSCRIDLVSGIKKTVEYYRDHMNLVEEGRDDRIKEEN